MKRQYPNAPDRIYYNPDTSIEIEGKFNIPNLVLTHRVLRMSALMLLKKPFYTIQIGS